MFQGAENCMEGLSFVITGILESVEREQAVDLVKRHGGKVVSAVSKKTNYLVVGRDPGESKLQKVSFFIVFYFTMMCCNVLYFNVLCRLARTTSRLAFSLTITLCEVYPYLQCYGHSGLHHSNYPFVAKYCATISVIFVYLRLV